MSAGIHDLADWFEYNITKTNLTSTPIPCEYRETRQSALITHPSDYEFTITAFDIPTETIPIFTFIDAVPYTKGYYITYQLEDATPETPEPVVFSPAQYQYENLSNESVVPYNRSIDNYRLFVAQVNNALNTAWYDVAGAAQPITSTAPFIRYDPNLTATFTLYVPQNDGDVTPTSYEWYDGSNFTTSFKIYMNQALNKYFRFPSQSQFVSSASADPSPNDYSILFQNMLAIPSIENHFQQGVNQNGVFQDLWALNQEFDTRAAWLQYSRILIGTNSIPVYKKAFGDASNPGNNSQLSLLEDFNIVTSSYWDRSSVELNGATEFKWHSLMGRSPLVEIDLSVKFMGNRFNQQLPAMIGADEIFSVNFLFRRRFKLVQAPKSDSELHDVVELLREWVQKQNELNPQTVVKADVGDYPSVISGIKQLRRS